MTTGEFADLVEKMRDAQKNYSKTCDKDSLDISRRLESQVDKILAERIERKNNPGLFDESEN
jgi:hypothetical protein